VDEASFYYGNRFSMMEFIKLKDRFNLPLLLGNLQGASVI